MRKFYIVFQKGGTLSHQLTWSHYYKLLSINDENKRNYYINMCIKHNLSVRKLIDMIKSDAYERLSYVDKENIELITENKGFSTLR